MNRDARQQLLHDVHLVLMGATAVMLFLGLRDDQADVVFWAAGSLAINWGSLVSLHRTGGSACTSAAATPADGAYQASLLTYSISQSSEQTHTPKPGF